jgi:hypothetical protein
MIVLPSGGAYKRAAASISETTKPFLLKGAITSVPVSRPTPPSEEHPTNGRKTNGVQIVKQKSVADYDCEASDTTNAQPRRQT